MRRTELMSRYDVDGHPSSKPRSDNVPIEMSRNALKKVSIQKF